MRAVSEYGRVAVLCGGRSQEREISLQSGAAVEEGLISAGVDAVQVDTRDHNIDFSSFDRAFVALHGRDGEDGKIQAVLEYFDIPFTGSDVSASSISMNKWYTKAAWQSVGVNTPAYSLVGDIDYQGAESMGFPVFVKPANEGSSIGVTHVAGPDELDEAVELASRYDKFIVIEQAIRGREYSYSFIDGVPDMPIIELQPAADFYDYEAKYFRDDTQYIVDPDMSDDLKSECISQSELAYKTIGMSGWGRVDFIVDENDQIWFIEVNSVPGMTNHSLVPMSARAAGFDFSAACMAILETSFDD